MSSAHSFFFFLSFDCFCCLFFVCLFVCFLLYWFFLLLLWGFHSCWVFFFRFVFSSLLLFEFFVCLGFSFFRHNAAFSGMARAKNLPLDRHPCTCETLSCSRLTGELRSSRKGMFQNVWEIVIVTSLWTRRQGSFAHPYPIPHPYPPPPAPRVSLFFHSANYFSELFAFLTWSLRVHLLK